MKYIALEKQCAHEIAKKGVNFSGRLKGILSSDFDVVPRHGDPKEYTKLVSGCLFDIQLDNGELGQLTFKIKNAWHDSLFPVVLALPLQGQQVELIGNNTIKFDIECSNELWNIIIENYRKRTIARVKEELGIDVTDILKEETTIIDYEGLGGSVYNADEFIYERTTRMMVDPKFYFINHVIFKEEDRNLLSEMYEKRSYLFDPNALERREVESINITENENEIILKLGGFFGGTEKIQLTNYKGKDNDQ